jgi:hypothetical protein
VDDDVEDILLIGANDELNDANDANDSFTLHRHAYNQMIRYVTFTN